jgi:hypothetical protein
VHRIHTNVIARDAVVIKIRESLVNHLIRDPMNNTIDRRLIIKILVYSAIKIKAKAPLLYSVLNPETNSDSPSARSNGVRFVSANIVVNQMIARGNIKNRDQV